MAKIAAEPMEQVKFRTNPKVIRGVAKLAGQRGEDMADMWREVSRYGELIAAMRSAPDPATGLYGTRTAQELAAELRSIAADARDFVDRFSISGSVPAPASTAPPATSPSDSVSARNGHHEPPFGGNGNGKGVALHASVADDLGDLGFGG